MNIESEILEPQAKPKRPNDFTDDIFDVICGRMADGEGLRKICEDPEMPSRQTFLRWIEKDTGRQAKYQQAREALMDWYGEEILDIAWDSSKDTIPATKNKPPRCDNEWVARSRLKVDTLKFLMAKLHPRRYGDKLPETVEEKTGVAELMAAIDGKTRSLEVSWIKREIVQPIHDDGGTLIDSDDPAKLRARIRTLEERLGMREGKPLPPKQLTYDPGPLPSRMGPEVERRFLQMIKGNVPHADQRTPEEVLEEVLRV
jgi:hypothetical protein